MNTTTRRGNIKMSEHVHPISPICMKCQGSCFTSNESERQKRVLEAYGLMPSDCISSTINGIKCPFETGEAYETKTTTRKIS